MTLAILFLAGFALVAYAASAVVGLARPALEHWLEARAPAAQARVLLSATLLPGLLAGTVLVAALAPSFGWIADHCDVHGDVHTHPHICAHHVAVWPSTQLTCLALFMVLRFAIAVGSRVHAVLLGRRMRRQLDGLSEQSLIEGVRVLPRDDDDAFVLGVVTPTLYVARSLLSGDHSCHLEPVIAHERAHVRRQDPLRRLIAGIGLSFHLPGIARKLEGALARAQEMAADEDAARALGSRERVARALVALARARRRSAPALPFTGSDLERRVNRLLMRSERRDVPGPAALLVTGLVSAASIVASAEVVHHGLEQVLGLMGN